MKKLLLSALLIVASVQAQAAIIQFTLEGTAGTGLLFGNEPAVASGGSGGEIGAGITFDDVSNLLAINVGWGSSQGFSDMSSATNNSHIHVTANNFGNSQANGSGPNFVQTGGTVFTLTRSSNLATGGTNTQSFTLTAPQKTDLLNGKYYINIHTATNGGGEIRGFLVPAVPEPGTASLLGLGALALAARRRRG